MLAFVGRHLINKFISNIFIIVFKSNVHFLSHSVAVNETELLLLFIINKAYSFDFMYLYNMYVVKLSLMIKLFMLTQIYKIVCNCIDLLIKWLTGKTVHQENRTGLARRKIVWGFTLGLSVEVRERVL